MGLFDLFNKTKKQIVIPEPDEQAVAWFFTDEASNKFRTCVSNTEDILQVWFSPNGNFIMTGFTTPKGNIYRRDDFLPTFFADYLRALKTIDMAFLAANAARLAIDDETVAIPFPDCLKAEYNPLINFAIKIKPIYYHKNGKELQYNSAMKSMIAYLHDCYVDNQIDESNEDWIYEESLWFDSKGKERNSEEILADIKAKVKYSEIVLEF